MTEDSDFDKLITLIPVYQKANELASSLMKMFPPEKTNLDSSRPTQRAADKWDSPRFLAVFNASAESCSQALSASRPLAANANR